MEKLQAAEKRFCRLCGKYREEGEFSEFTLITHRGLTVLYNGCKSCKDVIRGGSVPNGGRKASGNAIHNAKILATGAILRAGRDHERGQAWERKIVLGVTLVNTSVSIRNSMIGESENIIKEIKGRLC